MVVDDNRDAAESLVLLLEAMGHETAIAHLGTEAVEKAEVFEPDLVILDIGLPDLDGYEVCRWMRSRPWSARTVIAACTGWSQDADKLRSREAGFDRHVVKPADLSIIHDLLHAERSSTIEAHRERRAAADVLRPQTGTIGSWDAGGT